MNAEGGMLSSSNCPPSVGSAITSLPVRSKASSSFTSAIPFPDRIRKSKLERLSIPDAQFMISETEVPSSRITLSLGVDVVSIDSL